MTMFNNCYTFNPPHSEIVSMGRELEQLFLAKIADMPSDVSILLNFSPGFRRYLPQLLHLQPSGRRRDNNVPKCRERV